MLFEVKLVKLILTLLALIPCFKILSNSAASSIYDNIANFGPLFQLCTTSTWKEFILNRDLPDFKRKKWAWIGMITLKSKIPLKLKTLNLQWYGKKIEDLQASLYQKREMDPSLIPIQQNLVCDGTWNSKKQELSFNINQKVVSINNYYLVLSFSKQAEEAIKAGKFTLQNNKSVQLSQMEQR
jgi:hypothetical protein